MNNQKQPFTTGNPRVLVDTNTEDLGNGIEIQTLRLQRVQPVGTPLPTIPEWLEAAKEAVTHPCQGSESNARATTHTP